MDKEKVLISKTRTALRNADIIRHDDTGHLVLDISRLKSMADDDIDRMRNVGKAPERK